MINNIIEQVNRVINISRSDTASVVRDLLESTKHEVASGKKTPTIFGFFQDVVVNIDWGKPHVESNFDRLFQILDQNNEIGQHYYRLFDIFDHAIKNYLSTSKISYSDYVQAVVGAIANVDKYNLKLESALASSSSTTPLLSKHTWVATLYILSHTDLAYIINIDLPKYITDAARYKD